MAYGDLTEAICVPGAPFYINVVDPCPSTEIVSAIFPDIMSQPRLRTETLNLRDRIAIGKWEWKNSLDISTEGKYGALLCGPIEYTIMTDESVPQTTDIVSISGDVLTFSPMLYHPIGFVNLLLVGRLQAYNDVVKSEPFQVEVTPCIADIISFGA